jgi:hypothetical protein
MRNYPRSGSRLAVAAFAAAVATLIAGESRADFDLGQGIVLAPSAQIPQPPGVTSEPIAVTVNCSSGGTVAQALALKPLTNNRLTITINGTCTEAVDTGFSGYTLQGGSSGGALQAPSSSTDPVLGISGQHVILNNLTISGGLNTVRGRHGGQFTGKNLVIQGASNADVLLSGATVDLNGSTIQNSSNDGVDVNYGSVLFMNGGAIQNNAHWGVQAFAGGSADLYGGVVVQNNAGGGGAANGAGSIALNDGTVKNNNANGTGAGLFAISGGYVRAISSNSSVVQNVGNGIFAGGGGSAEIVNGALVANNSGYGVLVNTGGHALVHGNAIIQSNTLDGIRTVTGAIQMGTGVGPVTIQSNGKNGIYLGTNSVASFGNSGNQIINNGNWGILCAGSPSDPLGNGSPGTVSGNTSGQIACNFGN